MPKYSIFISILLLLVLTSCTTKQDEINSEDVIAEVHGEKLFRSELVKNLPRFLNEEDSAEFANTFIDNWIGDRIVYSQAKLELTDTAIIVQKIDEYRKQLYVHYYKENIVYSDISLQIKEEEIEDYYNKHLNEYVLASSYVKAHFLTMDAKVNTYSDEWEKINRTSLDDKKFLKDYCIGTGRKVFFVEEWTEIRAFLDLIKYNSSFDEQELVYKKVLDYINGDTRYLVKIDDYVLKGNLMPYELARPSVIEIIISNRKRDKYIQIKNQLKEDGLNSGAVKIYNN